MSNSTSKSMFSNSLVLSSSRYLYNPISTYSGTSSDLDIITSSHIYSLEIIEKFYTSNMSNKTYEMIPNNYNQYIQLYMILNKLQKTIHNSKLLLLLNIIREGLVGSINSYTIYGENISLRLDKRNLELKVDEILSNKNVKMVNMSNTSGQMSIKKTIKLAAVFNYYILIYGMPEYGVGFDPIKISYLVDILKQRGIHPYK
jgi:hypothetical protein